MTNGQFWMIVIGFAAFWLALGYRLGYSSGARNALMKAAEYQAQERIQQAYAENMRHYMGGHNG